jgi:hypothetical protein
MARGAPHLVVEGYEELQRNIKKVEGKLPASIGEAHKEVGRFLISKIPTGDPHAVGVGKGAEIRASAKKRDLNITVGGAHRAHVASKHHLDPRIPQWGKTPVPPFPKMGRPYILDTIYKYEDEIIEKFNKELEKALDDAFYKVDL